MGALALTLLAGTPALTFIGLIGAALSVTLAARRLAAGGAGAAADDPGADLRRRRGRTPRSPAPRRSARLSPFFARCPWRLWCWARSPPPRRCGMDGVNYLRLLPPLFLDSIVALNRSVRLC